MKFSNALCTAVLYKVYRHLALSESYGYTPVPRHATQYALRALHHLPIRAGVTGSYVLCASIPLAQVCITGVRKYRRGIPKGLVLINFVVLLN